LSSEVFVPVRTETAHELVDAIFLLGRTMRSALAHNETAVLPNTLVGVLILLARAGECRPSELAAEMCVSQSSLSRQIGELVERGLVERRPDPGDRRAHTLRCTRKGLDVLESVRELRTERLSAELADWDQQQVDDAIAVLRRLNASLLPIATATAQRTSS